MNLKVYLSGEIHTNWRDEIIKKCKNLNLQIEFTGVRFRRNFIFIANN